MLSARRKEILELLQQDGRMSLSEVGRRLGITHISVRKQLNKMIDEGLVRISAAVNPEKMGLKMVVIVGEIDTYKHLQEFMTLLKDCPRVIFLSTMLGAYNFMAMMVAEDPCVVRILALGMCCIRNRPGIRRSDIYLVEDLVYPTHIPLRINSRRDREVAPCGVHCGECQYYQPSGECICPACPATKYYRGPL